MASVGAPVEEGGAASGGDDGGERGICMQDRLVGFLTSGDELLVTEVGGTWVLEHNDGGEGGGIPGAAATGIKAQAMDKPTFRAFIRRVNKAITTEDDDGETTGSESSSSNDEDDDEDGEFVPADEDEEDDEEEAGGAGVAAAVSGTTTDVAPPAHNARSGVNISSGRDVYYRCSFGVREGDNVGEVGLGATATSATASRADSS